ncbi:hypothetical protein [Nocardia thailandica]
MSPAVRLRGTAPRRWTIAMTSACGLTLLAVAMLVWEQAAGSSLLLWVLAVPLLAAAGLTWMICGPIGLARHRAHGLVAATPVVAIVGALVLGSSAPERLSWRLSREPLTVAARACVETSDRHRFGLLTVRHVHRADGGCRFAIADDGGTWGLAHFPGLAPPPSDAPDATEYSPYDGPWYRYRLHFG